MDTAHTAAGIESASIPALTIPAEPAVLRATALARRLRPGIYIIARTTYTSAGLRASQLGADEVIKAEQAVALQSHERMWRRLSRAGAGPGPPDERPGFQEDLRPLVATPDTGGSLNLWATGVS
ncbi:MAG TPA: NAD-binding protein [Phycisphaerae bacterium]|nr:NAD-binding protein [Phycisphaerae bacterium]